MFTNRIVLMLGIVITCFIYIHLIWSMTLEETFASVAVLVYVCTLLN